MKKKVKTKAKVHEYQKKAKAITKSKSSRATKKVVRLAPKLRMRKATRTAITTKKVVRIMGHGQFTVDARTLRLLNEIDNELVTMVASEKADDLDFKKKLAELNQITMKRGKAIEPGEIIRSDIILPSAEMPVDEAKKLFIGEGVIPEN